MVSIDLLIYIIWPTSYASGVGYVTWRNITLSSSAVGFSGTSLSANITTTGQTTMSVNSSACYRSPPFIITLGTGKEAIDVTAISGTTWTISRGYDGTTATTYSSGTSVSDPDTYQVSFVPATPAASIQAIVVDFCSDSPIYNSSTCFTPSGMTIGNLNSCPIQTSVGNISGISGTLFSSSFGCSYNRAAYIAGDGGTGFVPLSATTLASPFITSTGQTSFNVSSSSSYPAASSTNPSSWFYVSIPSTGETMQVTNISGTVWTVNRGALGTSAAIAGSAVSLSQPPIAFSIFGNTNPTSTGPLYARIYTFSNYINGFNFGTATASSGILTVPYSTVATSNIDGGGVALYITSPLIINSKVQEFLQFCIYTASGGPVAPCSLSGSTVTLGNSSGILSMSSAYVDSTTRFDAETNASAYAAITFTGAPLSNGSLFIENSTLSGTGTVATTAYTSTLGTDQFGLCVAVASTQQTGENSANLTLPNNTYNGTGGGACPATWATSAVYAGSSVFGLNIAQANSVYGDLLAIQKPGQGSTGVISFLGNVAASQLAGIYTTTFNFVATGTY